LGRGGFVFGGEWMKTSGYLGVRNGLILDPKHREKIGPALFLFLYLMANADYVTGKLDRKIGTISDDMGKVPKRTVEHWIGILKKGKYIKTTRLHRAFHIEILKWWHPNHQIESSKSCGADDLSTATSSLVNRNILESNPQNLVEPTKSFGLINNQKQKEKSDTTAKSCVAIKNSYQESLKKKGGGPSPVINFLNFAGWTHKRFRRFPIVLNDRDRGRVQSIIDLGVGEKDLKRAWLLFLKAHDRWLEGKPRSIAIFKSQANDYLAAIPNPAPSPRPLETRPGQEEALDDEIWELYESFENESESSSNIKKKAENIRRRGGERFIDITARRPQFYPRKSPRRGRF